MQTPPLTTIWKSAFCLVAIQFFFFEQMLSQPCSQADTAISIGAVPIAQPVGSLEDWIGITPDSSVIRITVNSHADSTSGHVHRIVLYSGDCNSLVQITNDYLTSEEDSVLVIYARRLTPGTTYLLKLEFETDSSLGCGRCGIISGMFDISVDNLSRNFVIPNGVCIEACSNNLAVNGGFETGDATGFIAAGMLYPCNQQNILAFHHGICNNANDLHLNWSSPPRSGVFALFVDDPENDNDGPNITPEQHIWSRNVGVVPNTFYCFRGWFRNIVSTNCTGCTILPNVNIGVNGNITLDQTGLASTGPLAIQGPWTLLEFYWYSGVNTFANFYFYSKPDGTGTGGNDVGIDDVKIHGLASVPLIDVSPSPIICIGQQVTLTAQTFAENVTYSWSTGATTQSIQVSPTTTTIYTVVVNDGCASTFNQVIIRVIPTFSILVSPGCMGSTTQFTNNTFPNVPTTWSWNFGDPASGLNNTSTLLNPAHLFSGPGSYQVTLTANTSQCGIFTHTQTVQIVPSTPTYNPNCCSANQQLYTDNTISINTVSGPITTWNSLSKIIQFNLEVLPGATLIIQNSLIQFGPTGKLIVHPQAKVIVDNSTLRGLLSCGTMWMGVEVGGNSSKNQYQLDNNGNIFHGKFILRSNSFVIDAHNGTISGRVSGTFFNLSQSGGIIEATNSSFINCGISFKPVYYSYASASFVRDCSFSSTTLLDPGYGTSGPYQYPTNNPGFGYANALQRTWAHVSTANTRRIKFLDNTFTNSEYGVYSLNSAHWYIDGNQNGVGNIFSSMNQAMRMDYFWSSIFANRIEHNRFDNISGQLWIVTNGAKGDVIKRNRFNFQNIIQPQNSAVALALANSSGFKILDNEFFKMGLGIWSSNSGALGGLIGYETAGNFYDRCLIGERVVFNNPALQIKCNLHANDNLSSNPYFLDWQVLSFNQGSSLANQGNFPALTDKDPAGNEFNQLFPNQFDEIWSDFALFNYLHHSNGNGLSVIPGISSNGSQVLSVANLLGTGFLKVATSCAVVACPPPCPQRVGLVQDLTTLEGELNATLASLDGGNTILVINTINSGMSPGQLKNFLAGRFPLSDQALIAYINLHNTPPGIFKEVILENSPVSNAVRSVLYNELASIPPGISIIIKNAQSGFVIRTITAIEREIESVKQQILFIDTDAMIYYAEQDSVSDAVNAIGAQNNFDADEVISATWLQEQNFSNATSTLGNMAASTPAQQDYLVLQNLLLNLSLQGRSVFELTAAEEQVIRTIAGSPISSLARTNARAILFYIFNEDFTDEFNMNLNLREIAEYQNEIGDNGNTGILGNAFPNPSDGSVTIPYFINNSSGGLIRIFDTMGKEILVINANPGSGVATLNREMLSPGIYYLELNVEGSKSPIQKLIIY